MNERREKVSSEWSGDDGGEEVLPLAMRKFHIPRQLSRPEYFRVGKRRKSQCVNNVETWEGLYIFNLKLCPKFGLA